MFWRRKVVKRATPRGWLGRAGADVIHCGGISELKKIGIIAEGHRVELALHNPQSQYSTGDQK
ncbi:hypothetical protein MYX75_12010 [Acidobacteria bacterium AH-259-A15]|nr:hypothetical protein [Acidobacteria bacterium AH-259-A15]